MTMYERTTQTQKKKASVIVFLYCSQCLRLSHIQHQHPIVCSSHQLLASNPLDIIVIRNVLEKCQLTPY